MPNSRKKILNIIEGVGLILILFTAFIQQSETKIAASKQEYEYAKLHEKLDVLWAISSHQYEESHPSDSTQFWINFPSYLNEWKIYSEQKSNKDTLVMDSELNLFGSLRFVLFLIGSIMLIAPKFYDH